MMSVSLDEAIARRARGELVRANQLVSISSELMRRLTFALMGACKVLADRGKLLSNLPIVKPLITGFFRGDTAQSAASWNSLLHNVLLGDRSRFFHKLRILSNTVEQLGREFEQMAEDISAGTCVEPGASWKQLDSLHYDLNTCLRESEVILKSFLHSLPTDQLAALNLEMVFSPVTPTVRPRQRAAKVPA
jgi:hypothetical protein